VWTGQPVETTEPIELSIIATQCWDHVASPTASLSIENENTIHADPDRLKQLLENLFRNAIDHGGEDITIRIGTVEPDQLFIADDGAGIPAEAREKVFSRGYSTATDGTGLGLAIVETICDAHDWTVTVTTSEHGGARFEITNVDIGEQH
jgi:signal transduction histidine kinase